MTAYTQKLLYCASAYCNHPKYIAKTWLANQILAIFKWTLGSQWWAFVCVCQLLTWWSWPILRRAQHKVNYYCIDPQLLLMAWMHWITSARYETISTTCEHLFNQQMVKAQMWVDINILQPPIFILIFIFFGMYDDIDIDVRSILTVTANPIAWAMHADKQACFLL